MSNVEDETSAFYVNDIIKKYQNFVVGEQWAIFGQLGSNLDIFGYYQPLFKISQPDVSASISKALVGYLTVRDKYSGP